MAFVYVRGTKSTVVKVVYLHLNFTINRFFTFIQEIDQNNLRHDSQEAFSFKANRCRHINAKESFQRK